MHTFNCHFFQIHFNIIPRPNRRLSNRLWSIGQKFCLQFSSYPSCYMTISFSVFWHSSCLVTSKTCKSVLHEKELSCCVDNILTNCPCVLGAMCLGSKRTLSSDCRSLYRGSPTKYCDCCIKHTRLTLRWLFVLGPCAVMGFAAAWTAVDLLTSWDTVSFWKRLCFAFLDVSNLY